MCLGQYFGTGYRIYKNITLSFILQQGLHSELVDSFNGTFSGNLESYGIYCSWHEDFVIL
jgi:hypothetical protein